MSVSINESDIFQRSWANLRLHAIVGIVLTLLILAAMEQILRTEAKARQKADQLQLTLENMSQGIMLVTKDLQIPIINSRCGELLDLPAEFVEHPPRFDELVEFQTRTSESANARHRHERPLPSIRRGRRRSSRSANARCRTAP